MGKISFPLINVRKDAAGYWHLKHYTNDTAEEIEIPSTSDSDGMYTVFLTEVPDAGSTTDLITTTPPTISGLVEFRGQPIDSKTKRLLMSPSQFYVNYQTGEILFHPYQAGNKFRVDYWGKGSLIEADDINYLHNRISKLEKEHDLPRFLSFTVTDYENGTMEVGESMPRKDQNREIEFKWETTYPERLKENSIQITNLFSNQVIGQNLPNTGTYSVEFQEVFSFSAPGEIKFQISGECLNGEIIQDEFTISWMDRLYWGISPHKEITSYQVKAFNGTKLFDYIHHDQYRETLKFLDAIHHHKVIVTPERSPIESVVDSETSLKFIFDEPRKINIKNKFDIEIPYLFYCSTYPITSAVSMLCDFKKVKEEIN